MEGDVGQVVGVAVLGVDGLGDLGAARPQQDLLARVDVAPYKQDPADFVLQIEPSAQGAEKIAAAIAAVVRGDDGWTAGRVIVAPAARLS